MKILYDHQIFTSQVYGGISRYFYELINSYNTNKDTETILPFMFSLNHYIKDEDNISDFPIFTNYQFKGKNRLLQTVNKIFSISTLTKKAFNVFHPTYYDPYFLNYLGGKPFILTVHDMIHEKFSDNFPSRDKTSEHKRILCKHASKIIAISNNTKRDLIEIFGINESKIEVVYHGNSMHFYNIGKQKVHKNDTYILFVGGRGGYKNFERFIKATSILLHEYSDLHVICAGGGSFNPQEIALFKQLNLEEKVSQRNVNDEELSFLYSGAIMFVFPSLYEGFGIPLLEAFSCKCPVVCSDASSFPEIAGKAAEYFDPYDIESIYQAMKGVLSSCERREELRIAGSKQLEMFSWSKAARETQRIYSEVI